ncbi:MULTISPECIES: type I-E CRISPR-associated endoribonuclease Cas2 [unclassified Crossiella]|uniref:type I-E CRISPR-associated endoribonuclease Cas2 n=1 Tax=unclassified Crossiella TaxID=2620835 RepID=UPI001FFF9334|nr:MULTISPECIES: type I-E CRISPR-associated endoribonuclease Cas2 [unclassified Crossiella]MCK2244348.1 type I-E CRISPR-associated endoribonuclease Cas2 [Crossiella sp. S99.2]MCK2257824.1 type I-E CRISPR-associated endoribonuclease Cas2 [Crossiella sp. S99.1]
MRNWPRRWVRVVEMARTGRAIMVHQTDNQQGLAFRGHDHNWVPVDFEGIDLMLRPVAGNLTGQEVSSPRTRGWSGDTR